MNIKLVLDNKAPSAKHSINPINHNSLFFAQRHDLDHYTCASSSVVTCLPEPITVDHSLIWLHKHATNFAQVYTDQQTRNVRIWIRVLIEPKFRNLVPDEYLEKLGGFEVNSEKVGQLLKHDFVLAGALTLTENQILDTFLFLLHTTHRSNWCKSSCLKLGFAFKCVIVPRNLRIFWSLIPTDGMPSLQNTMFLLRFLRPKGQRQLFKSIIT